MIEFKKDKSGTKILSLTIVKTRVSNAPLPFGKSKAKCKVCGSTLKATTTINKSADEKDPTVFCPSCGWDESKVF